LNEGRTYTLAWRAQVLALPRRLSLAGVIAKTNEPAVADICRNLLTEISRWRTAADCERALAANNNDAR
jgi:hypothetical protein